MQLTSLHKSARRLNYWRKALTQYMLPNSLYRAQAKRLMASLTDAEREVVARRVNYYVRLGESTGATLSTRVGDYRYPLRAEKRNSLYFFDLYQTVSLFDRELMFSYLFGDITHEPDVPSFVKSRPIAAGTTRSAVMKLDALRHFQFVHDSRPFGQKRDMLVSRNHVTQAHRRLLLAMYHDHPLCDIGKTNTDSPEEHPEWVKPFMTIDEQLGYKFIACIEGNDVATNLKWVMSSNSLAVMPKPRYETWYMEGTLQPGVHYVEVKPDYSDLIEQMQHYIAHPAEAEAIIRNAHDYVSQFQNQRIELATQIACTEAYFKQTGQLLNV